MMSRRQHVMVDEERRSIPSNLQSWSEHRKAARLVQLTGTVSTKVRYGLIGSI